MVALPVWRGSQLALIQAPDIHSKVMLYVASSNLHLFILLCCWYYFIEKSCQWFVVIVYDNLSSLEVMVPFCDCIVNFISFLFCDAPFPLCVHESTLNSTYNKVAFNEILTIMKENLHTKYFPFTYKYVTLNKEPPIVKQNLHIFFFNYKQS